jgi:hypothetical protein
MLVAEGDSFFALLPVLCLLPSVSKYEDYITFQHPVALDYHVVFQTKNKLNSVALVRKRTIPTELPPPLGEVSGNYSG